MSEVFIHIETILCSPASRVKLSPLPDICEVYAAPRAERSTSAVVSESAPGRFSALPSAFCTSEAYLPTAALFAESCCESPPRVNAPIKSSEVFISRPWFM